MPGVAAVFTFADLERFMRPLPLFGAVPPGLGAAIRFEVRTVGQMPLCRDLARYVGEVVAMVVADSPERAWDAVERIEVEWELLPVVVDMVAAARPGGPLVHPGGTNVAVGFRHGIGNADQVFADAPHVFTETFQVSATPACRWRPAASSPSGTAAAPRSRRGTAPGLHFVQQGLAGPRPAAHRIRVIAPDLGGRFGTKASGYAEDLLVPARRSRWVAR